MFILRQSIFYLVESKKNTPSCICMGVSFLLPIGKLYFYKGNKGKGLYKKCFTCLQTHNNMVFL